MAHALWIVPLVLLIAYLASPRFRGDIAQTRVRRILATGLEKSRYTVFNDITLPSGGGTVRIDHLVVSRFGVFVVKSQYAPGSVAGEEFQDRWKLHRWGRVTRIDNPLHRNALQVEALAHLLKIPARALHPVVVLVGHSNFRSAKLERVLAPENLLAWIRKKSQQMLDAEQAETITRLIEASQIRSLGKVGISASRLLQVALLVVLIAGCWFAFRDQVAGLQNSMAELRKKETSPELYRSDGTAKTEQEVWEDSLVCAWSADTGRCACYDPGGSKVDIKPEKCRSLAERGSVLKR